MKIKKIIAGLMAVLLISGASLPYGTDWGVLSIQASAATETTDSGFEYEKGTDSIKITKYTGDDEVVEIPSEIDGMSVTEIGDYAFANCTNLTKITIPDSITSIGSYAFYRCSSLEKIDIPDNVTFIDFRAFYGCTNLTKIYVSENNTTYSSDNGVLFNKDKSNLMYYPAGKNDTEYNIPDSVKSIDSFAFYDCSSLIEITIPEGITSIADSTFTGCSSLTTINIPDSVTYIGKNAFYGCSGLTEITIPDSVTEICSDAFLRCTHLTKIYVSEKNAKYSSIDGVLFNKEKSELIFYPVGKNDTEYDIPDGVISIGTAAFYGCSNLIEINIPDSVTSIDNYTFGYCSNLTEINISNSVTSIGVGAFKGCSNLTEINIPDGITSISSYAFQDCSSLTEINIPDSVTDVGFLAFVGCLSLKDIYVSENNTIYSSNNGVLFNEDKSELICYPAGKNDTEYTIPDSVTSIDSYAFSGCSSLTEINIPDSVTSISTYAFSDCTNLTEIIIPKSVTIIKPSAFDGCSNLTEINIPDSVTYIGTFAFRNCKNLTKIVIPESVTGIGPDAFQNCDNLTIYGNEGSYAQTFAIKNNVSFKVLGESDSATGDVNGDDTIDINDVVTIMCYVTDPSANPLDDDAIIRGDVYNTGDGINSLDALAIQKYLVKLIDSLPEK